MQVIENEHFLLVTLLLFNALSTEVSVLRLSLVLGEVLCIWWEVHCESYCLCVSSVCGREGGGASGG